MKTNIGLRIKDFIASYALFFFLSIFQEYKDIYHNPVTYYLPAIAALISILFFTKNAVWPIYKKGDKVWWSTYGEDNSTKSASTNQKRVMQLVSYFCFLFTLEIFNKKAPIYLSLKDYIAPAVFSLIMVLFLSRDAIWPIYRKKSAEAAS